MTNAGFILILALLVTLEFQTLIMLGELKGDQIENLLMTQIVGRIGCSDHRGIYVVPITYVYDGSVVIGHTTLGKKVDMMRNNPQVCFEVDHVIDMRNWQSVIAWGRYEELRGRDASVAMRKFLVRIAPLVTSDTAVPEPDFDLMKLERGDLKTIVYQILLGKKTGRFERSRV